VKMRILISNDDGIYSPGIRALAKAAGRKRQRVSVMCELWRLTWSNPQ